MSKIWKNNKKYFIPAFLSLICLFVGYIYRDCRESEKSIIVSGIKIEDLRADLKANSDSLRQIGEDFNKASRKLDKIGDCLNREIIPALNKINKSVIQPIELTSLSKSINEYLGKLDLHLASIKDSQEKTSFLIASSIPENLITVDGKIKSINEGLQKMEFWTYAPMIAGQDIPDKKLSFNYTPDILVVSGDRPIVDTKAIKSEQNAEIKYFKWKGNLYIKSIKILEEPQTKKK